jgi:hypothetical protein
MPLSPDVASPLSNASSYLDVLPSLAGAKDYPSAVVVAVAVAVAVIVVSGGRYQPNPGPRTVRGIIGYVRATLTLRPPPGMNKRRVANLECAKAAASPPIRLTRVAAF